MWHHPSKSEQREIQEASARNFWAEIIPGASPQGFIAWLIPSSCCRARRLNKANAGLIPRGHWPAGSLSRMDVLRYIHGYSSLWDSLKLGVRIECRLAVDPRADTAGNLISVLSCNIGEPTGGVWSGQMYNPCSSKQWGELALICTAPSHADPTPPSQARSFVIITNDPFALATVPRQPPFPPIFPDKTQFAPGSPLVPKLRSSSPRTTVPTAITLNCSRPVCPPSSPCRKESSRPCPNT